MKKLLAVILVLVCVFSLVACNKEDAIVSIDLPDGGYLTVLEYFYEDEVSEYYFPCSMSGSLTITYSNGDSELFVTALKEGRATIADLDRFDIKYYTEPK